MDNFVKLSDVFHILDLVMNDEGIKRTGKAIRKRLKELPSADVVEVVRCEKCVYGDADYGNGIQTPFQYYCKHDFTWNRKDHYCSYGERKEGAENDT